MTTVIELKDISKTYNPSGIAVHALQGINLTIEKGEFTVVVGPSGSGKTTLLNIIGGLDQPTTGTVTIDGIDISTMKTDEMIEFRLNHIGFLTAKENVEFIMLLQNIAKAERDQRAIDILDEVGLKDRLESTPVELSGGQQQRVAVARALASHPSFVLADEPTANLDSVAAESLLEIMEHLNHEHGMTFLFSTHDPRVMKRAHRILTLEDGVITTDKRVDPHAS
jgi:putative ABC transport system ATP-binding protein